MEDINQQLHEAAIRDQIKPYNINYSDQNGNTRLHLAVRRQQESVVEFLINHGADVEKATPDGQTPLHLAASLGLLEATKHILSHGANKDREDKNGFSALNSAVRNGHLDVVRYFISQGASVNQGNTKGWTPLNIAAFNDKLDVMKYLISQLAEVNKGNNDGRTALFSAAYNAHLDVTKYLISKGAEVNKGDIDGRTALHVAARNGHLDVTKYLISRGAEVNKGNNYGGTAVYSAAFKGHLDVTVYLISVGAEVKKKDNDSVTALHGAAQEGHLDVTKYLISQGAEVNKGDIDGRTALHVAAQNGHLDVIKYLISQGAEVNKGDNDGFTALHDADKKGHCDVNEYLISQGAEVNNRVNDGETALHGAAQKGHLDVVKVLLEGGARSDSEDIQGHTALQSSSSLGYQSIDRSNSELAQNDLTEIHLAIQHGRTSIIEKLVSEGADLNVQSTDGQTCLHKAIKLCYKSVKIVQETDTLTKISDEYYKGELSPEKALVFYLLDNGAKFDVKDERGNLPIQYAKDELVKQMILSRVPSVEEIKSYRDEPSTPAIVSVEVKKNTSEEIELEDHGVSMFIPSEAVHQSDPCKITLTLLRDPPSVDIQDDESVACYGIRCDPPNMIFHQPVEITIPHSTLVINPDQVKPDIVSRVWDSVNDLPRTSRMISSSSPGETPYCRVYKTHIKLHIGHSAEWWVLIPLEQRVIRHQLMCTPYIPDTIERGRKIVVHLLVHANLPGMDAEVQEEEKKQSYHKVHPSVPISIATKSGDVQVTCHRQDEIEQRKSGPKDLSLNDVQSKLKHSISLTVTSREEDTDFPVTITITQTGKVGVSKSVSFLIRIADHDSFIRVVEEVSRTDLEDVDVHAIAGKMTVNQFYDVGVALGFRINQLDNIEHRSFKDRRQASYDMLVTWRQAQPSRQEAKETLLSVMKSLDSPAEEMEMTDIGSDGEVTDKTLLAISRKIKPEQFFKIGGMLGFSKTELQHILHRSLYNRKDANIQMLSIWKASQTSENKAIQTLKLVWKSVQAVLNVENLEDEGSSRKLEQNPLEKTKLNEPTCKAEDMEIIETSDFDVLSGTPEKQDLDRHGGVPDTEELCSVALPVKSLSLVCSLGKALRLNDDLIVGFIDLNSLSELHKIARQLLDSWWNGLKEEEKEDKFAELLSEFQIPDVKTVSRGREEISNAIGSKTDLLELCHRLNVKTSGVLQIMSTFVTFLPHTIGRSVIKMLNEWVHQGGTRERLLEVAQAFRFNDAAVKIAEAMKCHPNYIPFISHGIIDHKGGELTLDELGIAVSIPEGAMPKGMRSVVTIRVPTHDTPRLPIQEDEVVITPVIECSLTQELLKPATVVLSHCTNHHERKDDSPVILYTKTGPGTFGRRNLVTPRPSHILKRKIKFYTRHLQVWALSSTDIQGLQLRCVVFQPLFTTPAEKSALRIYILHPYKSFIKDITRKEKSASVPYRQVLQELIFSIESTPKGLKILFNDGAKSNKRMVHIKSILSGKCKPLNFELQFSPEEKGKKNVHIDILQGSATLAERDYIISIEDEPDYAVDHTDSQGRLQFVSNNLLEILTDVIPSLKDLKSLGYQLGFSYTAVEKYLNHPDSLFDSVSRSGFGEMLCDWRRRVRPSEQVDELHLALQKAGLGHAAEVILPKLSGTSRRYFEQTRKAWESKK